MSKKIAIGSDHAGFELKQEIIQYLKDRKYSVTDKGTYSEERADYPDYAHAVAHSVLNKEAELGILMCGSGNGIAIAANRHRGIRAAIAWQPELASLARQHNAANVLVLPARFISKEEAFKCVDAFLSAEFEGGRHQQRIEKIEC
jgi:ribose 5-phosphate isomerase B